MDRKRLAMDTMTRLPLKETSGNLPSPPLKKTRLEERERFKPEEKKPEDKLNGLVVKPALVPRQFQIHQEKKSARLVGDELRSWQVEWRKIMKVSVVYFDTQGYDSLNHLQYTEFKKAQKALKQVGCAISPFFERLVSIIVSRRPFSSHKEYASTDIFHEAQNHKIKVWDYDKVFRFLKNLGAELSPAKLTVNGNLSNLLKEEKIFGSTDRDPNARRDDLHYLEKNFVYVYDLLQNVRPIAVREWLSDLYPSLHLTLDGKCPFILDTLENSDRKKLRRAQKFAATQEYRDLLKAVTGDIINNARNGIHIESLGFAGTSTSTDNDKTDHDKNTDIDTIVMPSLDAKPFKPPAPLLRNSSCMPTNSNLKFYDVAASGYNGASNAVLLSMDSSLNSVAAANGNGLGPMVSQVPSKNINNLKRRIFIKKQKHKPTREHTLRPGYCENCRVKYDHFDDHIASNRHRNFACDDRNFKDIDDLIATLNESKSMGFVTSNGDFAEV